VTDVAFNTRATRSALWQWRGKNSNTYFYVKAQTMHEAANKLHDLGVVPDTIQFAGEIIEEKS
jgi:hypothetical protein